MAQIEIIDDDVELADNIATSLRALDHKVTICNKTTGAVHSLLHTRPDLIVLDVMFPENPIGGFDLARDIRKQKTLKNIPIIMLTGVNQHFPMDFSSKDIDPDWMPIQEFMEKPFKTALLARKIAKLLKKTTAGE